MAARPDLRQSALDIFRETLAGLDAGEAVRRAVQLADRRLTVLDTELELRSGGKAIYSVALGKAAAKMAASLDAALGDTLAGGVLSGQLPEGFSLPPRWRVYAGGHPVPNEASLAAARASFSLLRRADEEGAPVIFLVSGGGSAMLESPRDGRVTLADLRELNRLLVTCGASIAEVNAVRRAVSAVKGGGLAAAAPRAPQITLIVSDTDDARDVASGPTLPSEQNRLGMPDVEAVLCRHGLEARLPASVRRTLAAARPDRAGEPSPQPAALRRHYVLLDNGRALERASEAARARGFVVEAATDINEQGVKEGCAMLLARLSALRERAGGRPVCLVSGGEFACPVRGPGVGGRNSETVLRCALELAELNAMTERGTLAQELAGRGETTPHVVGLSAGTDGIDGNSPAAGALCDERTVARARALGLDARRFLDASDAHAFFAALGDALITGPTGTNVRDLRLLLAE